MPTARHFFQVIFGKISQVQSQAKMTSSDSFHKLDSRILKAENMSDYLKKEIAGLKKLIDEFKSGGPSMSSKHLEEVKLENEKLKREIADWKRRLIETEKKLNFHQVDVSSSLKEGSSAAASIITREEVSSDESISTQGSAKEKVKPKATKEVKASPSDDLPVDVGRLDLRIGKIVSVKKHPDADSLYVEEVDVGEGKPRTVVSGLVNHVPIDEMENRMVVLLCNLKPAKMRGVTSEAMVLCASTPEKVEVLMPPEGAAPGDRVVVEGYSAQPDAVLNPKKKIFETVAPFLKTDDNKIATYKGSPFTVPGKGNVTTSSLTNVNIK